VDEGRDERHARLAWRVAVFGTLVVGGGMTAIAAASGAGGRAGLRFLILGAILACSVGALLAIGSGVVDAARGEAVGRGRVVAAVVLGGLVLLLPPMLVGIGG
jgi:hypothetical protein